MKKLGCWENNMVCENCIYFNNNRCHRFPPSYAGGDNYPKYEFPIVYKNDFCGEFKINNKNKKGANK